MTYKSIIIQFSNGERYAVPVDIIQENRWHYYAERDDISIEECRIQEAWYMQDDFELIDWVKNNMNWSDLEEHATIVDSPAFDYDATFGEAEVTLE